MDIISECKIEIFERTYGTKVSKIASKPLYNEREVRIDGELLFQEKYKHSQHLSNKALDDFLRDLAEKEWNNRSNNIKDKGKAIWVVLKIFFMCCCLSLLVALIFGGLYELLRTK